MRYNKSKNIKEVLDSYLKAFKLTDKFNEVRLNQFWESMMGNEISRRTLKMEIKNKKLYIFLDSSILRSELSYARNRILESINAEFGERFIEEVILM
jgi:hypothetical protein